MLAADAPAIFTTGWCTMAFAFNYRSWSPRSAPNRRDRRAQAVTKTVDSWLSSRGLRMPMPIVTAGFILLFLTAWSVLMMLDVMMR